MILNYATILIFAGDRAAGAGWVGLRGLLPGALAGDPEEPPPAHRAVAQAGLDTAEAQIFCYNSGLNKYILISTAHMTIKGVNEIFSIFVKSSFDFHFQCLLDKRFGKCPNSRLRDHF